VPPALSIFGQVLFGVLLGLLGIALATPVTAASLVLVKMLYLHEVPRHHE
jgi:predicted PurR-regulated permease PerM